MSKADYKLLAKAIAEAMDDYSWPMACDIRAGINATRDKICDALLVDNSRFDKDKFLAAIKQYQVKGKQLKSL